VKKLFPVLCVFSSLIAAQSFAGSATWSANPVSGDWNTAANWIPATVPNGPGDVATFSGSSISGTSTISVATQISTLTFTDSSTAGQSTITISDGAFLELIGTSNAGSAQITLDRGYPYLGPTAYAGPNASIVGNSSSIIQVDGQNDVQVTINDGYLSAGSDSYKSPSVGSIAGDDLIVLNRGSTLTVGGNNLSTEFDGVIINDEDTGRCGGLTKVGTGTLTLTAAQEYCLGTTVNSGVLLVKNTSGSGAGGVVHVNGGTLGGRGIISENVAVGTGSGTGAVLAPSQGASNPTTITLHKLLTFKADGSYFYRFNTNKATADQVIAQGVKIDSGAQFDFKTVANKKLTAGTVFTAISNTAATPITDAFSNLADGSTVTIGVNKLQVSYSGGDGNDLTLTVVQ